MTEKPEENERIIEIELERLRDFKGHPFQVKEDQQMAGLMESMERYGILVPLLVRPVPEGCYEIISGHRRKYAAEKLGFRKVPVIIRTVKDDDAVIGMVDSNLHRDLILPSEKAFALKMKYEAMRQRNGRKKKSQIDYQPVGKKTVQIMGEQSGESPKQIQRYLKITELIPELLDRLDNGKISFNPAFTLAFLSEEDQRTVLAAMICTSSSPSLSQAQRIKKLGQEGKITPELMKQILGEVKKGDVSRVSFKNETLYRFFPRSYSTERMKQEILDILRSWSERSWDKQKPETT